MVQSSLMKPSISYPDFEKLDIRVGTIVEATAPEWSLKLLRFVVDFGPEIGTKTIFSGIKKWYAPQDFVGKQFPFLINLEPKKMGEEESQGMMLMADGEEKPILFEVGHVQNGTMVR
ncbi:MAG TPA: methionine--tRNA ligase [Patescibacteria group bacterium]|nr:methionine--tRNA ligase [Patescibacteria group bacterium]